MQRIDENTSIDDTLVICADYQLFIDKMLEQRKHYQPDHWVSDQFLKGKAFEPIFGVRSSDAQAFCEWMTQRETGGWSYRLPKAEEAAEYAFIPPVEIKSNFGYWLENGEHNFTFFWINGNQSRSSEIYVELNLAPIYDEDLQRDLDIGHFRIQERFRNNALNDALRKVASLTHFLERDETRFLFRRDTSLQKNVAPAIDGILNIARRFENDRNLIRNSYPIYSARTRTDFFIQILGYIIFPFQNIIFPLFERKKNHERDRIRAIAIAQDIQNLMRFEPIQKLASSIGVDHKIELFNKNKDEKLVFYFYCIRMAFYLTYLQERIAGRSPAFEGIRLVKYRE